MSKKRKREKRERGLKQMKGGGAQMHFIQANDIRETVLGVLAGLCICI